MTSPIPAKTMTHHMTFWGISIVLVFAFLALFKSVLLPFILGMAIAYFLNPVINSFEVLKIKRAPAALIILVVFFLTIFAGITALVPALARELNGFVDELPQIIERVSGWIAPYIATLQSWVGENDTQDWQALVQEHAAKATNVAGSIASHLLAGSMAFMDFISLVVITPIMAYFMMKEWPHITAAIDDLLPRDSRETIVNLLKEIDQKLSAFVRGQITVIMMLALIYAIALSVAGLKFGILIGVAAGLLSIIPMVGSILGLLVATAVAFIQTSGDWSYAGIIALIFIVGQIVEGYALTPKLVGDSVGLHPLWVFFALMAGGSVFGVLGMLIAIPIAAIASVLVAFAIYQYKKTPYYKARSKPSAKKKPAAKAKAKKA